MGKAFRALIVGLMLVTMLAACGGATPTVQQTTTAAAPATTAAPVATTAAAEATTAAPVETTAATEATTAAPVETTAATEATTAAPAETTAAAMTDTTTAETATGTGDTGGTAAAMVTLPEVNPQEATGNIITAGSSTVFPLTQQMAERFKSEGYAGNITVDSIGSGAGFERFCVAAETDIANASRAIKDEEAAACREKGREVLEFRVGTDALSVVVSNQNTFLTNLTMEQLGQIYSGEFKTWNQVDPSYPNEQIRLYSPGTDSGTYDYFVEEVLDDKPELMQQANPQQSEDDNVLVQGVQSSPYAIGYFGYAYYNANKGTLKALNIDDVEPNTETTENGDYPLARPLFIYSATSVLQEKPQVASFINFYLTNVNDEIEEVGYFPASETALNEAKQNFVDAVE